MKTRILYTKVWQDELVAELSPTQKLLFLYYLTNDNIGLTGIYELTDRQTAFDTGLTQSQIAEGKEKFEKSRKIFFYKNWVYVVNSQRLNGYHGEKLEKAIKKELNLINTDITSYFDKVSKKTDRVSEVSDTSINHKSEIINNKPETIKEKYGLDYLRNLPEADVEEFNRKYEASKSDIRKLSAQLVLWCETNNTTKKNCRSFIQNRLLDKFGFRKKEQAQFNPLEVAPEISEEERQRNIDRIAQMKKLHNLN